ncbi:toll/interleukin-1 receptor domain-containing protein [Massilia sp. P8910]|uniref:toll/interleukin-1 receptor domain-containing protein n=1 Tax=Massilia antarctica TaxID=2765360 RepID=UPI001E6209CE|nr:toll/interleukin-1 receptor domain-containing protein [Massilia antarctica]MCE3604603.1 toll/interleukin-1 receptor domain-containing protein [Massilia antarctica]
MRPRKASSVALVKVDSASASVGPPEREADMAIRYGCFFSYAHGRRDGLMNTFKIALSDAIRCYLEPYFDNEDELFIDTEQLGGGDDIDRRIARALCESVTMILIYTPKYEAHGYTRREFAAMQAIEAERSRWYTMPSHLIIPVVMTLHPARLPPQITASSFYVDFSHFTMATGDLKSHPEFLPDIKKIVSRIVTQYEYQKKYTPVGHDCNQFVLPDVPPVWRDLPDLTFPKK